MSFGTAAALQAAVFALLDADTALGALVTGVHDEVPSGPVSGTYVTLGAGEVRDISDATGGIGDHRFVVSIISDAEGFAAVKAAAAAVTDALAGAAPVLTRGRVVCLSFQRARARRVRAGQVRRIDLTFGAIVEDN